MGDFRAFDAWDRFDHAHAHTLLESHHERFDALWRFLKLVSSVKPGYAPLLDLLRNAERRAARGRYDDAVARLYRALEMLAQIRLAQREPALQSGDLNLELLPETLRPKYEALREGKVKLSLRQDYELLVELADPLGVVYQEYINPLLRTLGYRNKSILAHGQTPIIRDDWEEMYRIAEKFIRAGLEALKVHLDAPQFPQWDEVQK